MGRSKAPSLPIKALSFCRPTELRGKGGGASHQRENVGVVHEVYDSLFFSSNFLFPLEGKCHIVAKGCTGQSSDVILYRYPDRQSAACVIFASYHWTHLRCEGSQGSKGSEGDGIALRCTANTFCTMRTGFVREHQRPENPVSQ